MKFRNITIMQRKDCNTWYARYRKDGKQHYISAKTQKDCYKKLKSAITNVSTTIKQEEVVTYPTLAEWYNTWLTTYKPTRTDETKRNYYISFEKLTVLHNTPLNKITSLDIMKELNKVEKPRARQQSYELVKTLLDKAKALDIIDKNPIVGVDKPEYTRTNGIPFSEEDEKIFVNICHQNKKYTLFLIGLYQGLRHGEILAITDKDIDFENRTLDINKSLKQNGTFGPTKNHSDRIQPIFDNAYSILKNYEGKTGRIFDCNYKTATEWFDGIKDKYLTNKKYTMKTLRFTFITKCEELGIPEHIVQKWVGHEIGSKVTKQVYTKVRTPAELQNIEKLNKSNSNRTHF